MYKRLSLLPILIILAASIALAHGPGIKEEIRTPEEVLNDIISDQGIASAAQADCSKISQGYLEELGDAVMERMAGNHELHEQMDAMMGGEGSASLRQMHISMGRNWLDCDEAEMINTRMMPMMMRMMGSYYPAYYGGFDAVLVFAFIGWVLFFVSVVYFLSRKKRRKK
ncbi:MAG: hypothetical protein HY514_02015 [Candidatus Aenigmarchaeota archaeon]|nr:hypothetical protein [Candidatus Aenigmarchaeota archaeon]